MSDFQLKMREFGPSSRLRERPSNLPYRNGVGIVVVNPSNLILVGKARGFNNIWKMPQGGVEQGESHLQAVKRELVEETGIEKPVIERQAKLRSATEYPDGQYYSKYMPGFKGQSFEWFLARVSGKQSNVSEFTPALGEEEFEGLFWAPPDQVLSLAHNDHDGDFVTFQRQKIYEQVFREFDLLQTPERAPDPKQKLSPGLKPRVK